MLIGFVMPLDWWSSGPNGGQMTYLLRQITHSSSRRLHGRGPGVSSTSSLATCQPGVPGSAPSVSRSFVGRPPVGRRGETRAVLRAPRRRSQSRERLRPRWEQR